MRKIIFLVAAALAISGCDIIDPPSAPPKVEVSFAKFQPIYLDVSAIDFVDEYKSPMQEPNVEHLVPISPTDVVHIWVKDRVHASGLKNRLQVIIKEGSIVSTALPKPEGFKGEFTDQARRYNAKLEVEMRIYSGDHAMSDANVDVTATRYDTLSESATVLERKAFFNKLVRDLMEAANSELERQMFRYFNGYISYVQTP